MPMIIGATFDGAVFRPDAPVALPPQTRVWLQFQQANPSAMPLITLAARPERSPPVAESALEVSKQADLDGPIDWSNNLDKYLYGSLVADESDAQDSLS